MQTTAQHQMIKTQSVSSIVWKWFGFKKSHIKILFYHLKTQHVHKFEECLCECTLATTQAAIRVGLCSAV